MDDDDDHAMEFHDDDDAGDNICVQHVMNTVLAYEAHGLSFHANIWDNIVDLQMLRYYFHQVGCRE